jgi:predicted ATPase
VAVQPDKMAEEFAGGLVGALVNARKEEARRAQTEFLDKGIPYLLASQSILGGATLYRIILPDGTFVQRRRKGPKGYWTEPWATTQKRAAVIRWSKERARLASKDGEA